MCEDKSIWMHGGGLTALVTDLNTIWLNVIILLIIIIIILTEMLVHAFITSCVDYCNSLLYGLPNYQLNKLQRVLNASARLVCNAPRFCHISPLLRGLHWLPVKARIEFKILLITFKEIHGLAPKYLCDFVTFKSTLNNLRSSDSIWLSMTAVWSKTLGDRAFMVAVPRLWKSLPKELRAITYVNSCFKAHIKAYLFKTLYWWAILYSVLTCMHIYSFYFLFFNALSFICFF